MNKKYLKVHGAHEKNLKNLTINIPKYEINAFVGVSGSGKSSLVFDTIASESQRQLNDTYSSFIRNRLPHYSKPKVDSIENLSPTIIINQKRLGENNRSTVGTATDIYALLRLLFSRYGSVFVGYSDVFSFNNLNGMCLTCEGLGSVHEFKLDELLDYEKTLNEGAICFPTFEPGSYRWKRYVDSNLFDNNKKLKDFTQEEMNTLLYQEEMKPPNPSDAWYSSSVYEGIIPRIKKTVINNPSKTYRKYDGDVERITKTTVCPTCHGKRLNAKTLSCKIDGKDIGDCSQMQVDSLHDFLNQLTLDENNELKLKLLEQLQHLRKVGLGYLSLDRVSGSLSGGESQRIKMVRQLGSSLSDLMYIFDEPSIGLHPHDIKAINNLIIDLKNKGNTILIVDHDKDMIQLANTVFELGPGAGKYGGALVFSGSYQKWIDYHQHDRVYNRIKLQPKEWMELHHLNKHNLQDVSVSAPTGVLTAITGVAGSGKSTFATCFKNQHSEQTIYINQKQLTGSNRSTIISYAGVFDEVRKLFAKATNMDASYFSFNSKGACKHCKGKGFVEMELAFMGSIRSQCEECEGKRFNQEALTYMYKDKTIADVLALSIEDAYEFFTENQLISSVLKPLVDIGLSYPSIGQTLNTLSGGELQRLKLALEINQSGKIFILDEPTTGLSYQDIQKLLLVLEKMISNQNTILMIEHNLDMIIQADWMIDFGPGAGNKGGNIVYAGRPEDASKSSISLTGKYLLF